MTRSVVLVGGGGHAKVVVSTLQAAGWMVTAVYDDDPGKWRTELLGVPIVGPLTELEHGLGHPAVLGVGANRVRKALAQRLPLEWVCAVHPTAIVHPSVTVGAGSVIFAGAVIQPDTRIGAHAIVNTAATVDHDCTVGDFAHLGPGCHLSGGVVVGEGGFLGIGSSATPMVSIGAWTTVGAGGVVVADLPSQVVAVGVPARPTREKR